jgi:hypothetical protein
MSSMKGRVMSRLSVRAVEVRVAVREIGWVRTLRIAVVSGRSPGLGAKSPGAAARVKRLGLWAGVIGAGGGRLTRAGEAGRRAVVVMVLGGSGAGSLTAFRAGMWLQSSIRSRWSDQSVVRGSGAQSSGRPS